MSSFLNAIVDFGKLKGITTFVKDFTNPVVARLT